MKFIRFFTIVAVAVILIAIFNTSAKAQDSVFDNGYDDSNACLVRKWDRKPLPDLFPPLPDNSILQIKTTHVTAIVRTEEEFNYQQKAFENAGIGPWLPPTPLQSPATYCGKPILLDTQIKLTQDFQTASNFYEIFRILGNERNFFSDYYKIHGPSLLYFGLAPAPGVSYEQVQAFLQEQNIPVVLHTEGLGSQVDFVRIGYAYAEIVTPIQVTN